MGPTVLWVDDHSQRLRGFARNGRVVSDQTDRVEMLCCLTKSKANQFLINGYAAEVVNIDVVIKLVSTSVGTMRLANKYATPLSLMREADFRQDRRSS